jgi:hypothetical protein
VFIYGGGIAGAFCSSSLVNLRLHEPLFFGHWPIAAVAVLFASQGRRWDRRRRGARPSWCRSAARRSATRRRWPGHLPRLPAAVQDRLALPVGGDDQRGRQEAAVLAITTTHYLILSGVLFVDLLGIVVRRNMITVLMSIELVLSAVPQLHRLCPGSRT